MKMNKKVLFATSILSLSMLAIPLATYAEEDIVIATVNGDKIMKSTLDGYMKVLKKAGKADMQAAIDDLVATEIALQQAKKSGLLERPEVQKAIQDYTRNVLLKTWTQDKVDSFTISDEEIKKAYDEKVTQLASKEFNARHILVKEEDEAKAIIKELKGGADFEKLAKEKSTGPSGSNGGSLGWFKAKTMVPAFANAVKKMTKGEISNDPVKTQFGYHIIKLEDSRDTKLPTLDSLKAQLKRVISQKKMIAYMLDIRKNANIKITLPKEAATKEAEETKEKTQ